MDVGGCLQREGETDGLCFGLTKIVLIVDKGESFVTLGEDARSVAFPIDNGLSHDEIQRFSSRASRFMGTGPHSVPKSSKT